MRVATPAGGRLVLLAFPRNRHGTALGIRQTGIPVGGLVAAATLPWIAHVASWRWALGGRRVRRRGWMALPLLSLRATPPPPREPGRSNTWGATATCSCSLPWGCLVVTGQYALVAFLALDLERSSGLTLAGGVDLRRTWRTSAGIIGRVLWGLVSDPRAGSRKAYRSTINSRRPDRGGGCCSSSRARRGSALIGLIVALAGVALIGYQGLWITMIAEVAGAGASRCSDGLRDHIRGVCDRAEPAAVTVSSRIWPGPTGRSGRVLAVVLVVALVPASLVRERGRA